MLPLLYVAYLIIEYFERKEDKSDGLFWNLQKYGPLFGAMLGLLPQCGFSILAAMLYLQGNITLGTMLAVFIATSDEAIPVLLSEVNMIPSLALLLLLKFIIAVACGWVVDHVLFPHQKILRFEDMEEEEDEEQEDMEIMDQEEAASACPCCYPQYPIWKSALIRTLKIYLFAFAATFVLDLLMEWIGTETLSSILLTGSWAQPLIAALFGFIPNCAATVILCQLYAAGSLSFASLLAGLITNAGLGLLVLFQYEKKKSNVWKVAGLLYAAAAIFGLLFSVLPI